MPGNNNIFKGIMKKMYSSIKSDFYRANRFYLFVLIVIFFNISIIGCNGITSEGIDKVSSQKTDIVDVFDFSTIEAYSDSPFSTVNNNRPYFQEKELTSQAFELYGPLDSLGRCSAAYACVGKETMPTEERGKIGQIKPSGWKTVKYDSVDGKFLYNRCHLIGYQLSAENANEKNLITGTRYLNTEGMLPFENMVADYIKETDNHVMYRVTPVFAGENLVASGVLMEAESVEDNGTGVMFCVFVYNIQPDIYIDYATGESTTAVKQSEKNQSVESESEEQYILNTSSKKFHHITCESVADIKDKNKEIVEKNREEIIKEGYTPCKNCNP